MMNIINFIKNSFYKKNNFESIEKEKCELGFLVLWVGTRCTLRCRDCGNLMPYSKQKSYDMDKILMDMEKVLRVCRINKLQIQGGEPFTHSEIDKLIRMIDKYDINEIVITTNGTVKLKNKTLKLLKHIKKNNFKIVVSSYKCVRKRQSEFYKILKTNQIPCSMYKFYKNDYSWVNQGGVETPQNNDDIKVQELYSKCEFKVCLSLVDGKIYRCGRAPVSMEVFKIINNKSGIVDVRGIKDINELHGKISEFLGDLKFKDFCRFCLGTKDKIEPAIQLKSKS